MCERNEKSTSLPEPTGPTDEQFAYYLTPAGKKALEDLKRVATAEERRRQRLRRAGTSRQNGRHAGTVHRFLRENAKAPVPVVRVAGDWLRKAGFEVGKEFEVEVAAGRLTIQIV